MTVQTGGYDERFKVMLGQERTAAGMTVEVLTKDFCNTNQVDETYTAEVTLPDDTEGSQWALGIQALSMADKYYLDIKEVAITDAEKVVLEPKAPTVSGNKVEGFGYSCTVTMPTENVDGSAIADPMSLLVLVDGDLAETRENCEPGSEQPVSLTLAVGAHKVSFKASNGEGESAPKTINVTIKEGGGDSNTLPFVFAGTQEQFEECLIFDENGDKAEDDPYSYNYGIWSYNSAFQAFKYTYNMDNAADDWIILPLVDFKAVRKVKVSLDVRTESNAENFEVYLGRERTVEGMTIEVLKQDDYKHQGSFETLSAEVSLPGEEEVPDADNKWCIGVHATSPANHWALYVNNFKIESMISAGVDGIESSDAVEAEYFDLQGMRISEPEAGRLVIERRGGKVVKKMIR